MERDVRFGTWKVRSLYRADSLSIVIRELARYKLELLGVQEVSYEKAGMVSAGDSNFFYGKWKENHQMGTGFLYTTE